MNIKYLEKERLFKIDTLHCSYIIAIVDEDGFLGHVYFGPYIHDDDISYLLHTNEYPFTPERLARERCNFMDTFLHEFSGNLSGDFRESGIVVTDSCNHEAVSLFYKKHIILNTKPELKGLPSTFADAGEGTNCRCMTLEITLEDPVLGLEVVLVYSIFEDSDAIIRSVRVINTSETQLILQKIMSVSFDMPDKNYKLLTLHGSWARERHIEYRTIGHGKQGVGSVCGKSSCAEHPFIGIVSDNITQTTGEVYGFHFVYSGNFLAQVEKNQQDNLRIVMGIHPDNFAFLLKPNECFYAPETVMVYSGCGLQCLTHTLHDLYRNHLIRSPYRLQRRPVLINNWEATYFDFNTDKLLDIAYAAKSVGIEMLVMDDGWFGKRNDDNTSLGDWFVNEKKLPGGLKYLTDKLDEIGMKFGIWFEPEMVCMESELYNKHPDWLIHIKGRKPAPSRNQYVLDLSKPEVVDYIYEMLSNILKSANISYVKWDMNRSLTDLGSAYLPPERQGELSHRYMLGVYELQERLITDFPNLLLENCSSGGARFDPGMLYYSPQIWCSDDTDAIERLAIQEGTALLFPLSTIGAHVSDCPNHVLGRNVPFKTRGHVAMAGTFGYELDVTKISEDEFSSIPMQVEQYQRYNDLVLSGDYYRVASYRENHLYDFYGVVSKDKKRALFTYIQVMNRPNYKGRILQIPGLIPQVRYNVQIIDLKAENDIPTYILHGDTLANAGIAVENPKGDFESCFIDIRMEY